MEPHERTIAKPSVKETTAGARPEQLPGCRNCSVPDSAPAIGPARGTKEWTCVSSHSLPLASPIVCVIQCRK